jgi:NADPH:quinone reductase-like Zn-dependent oxidoreductase
VLRPIELPEPHAGPGELRIRIRAATVNPVDLLIRAGLSAAFRAAQPPHIPGLDAAGDLDEIGPGTPTDLLLGQRVIAMVNPTRDAGGSYAEYVVLPANWVVAAPAEATYPQAATLPLSGLTARRSLDLIALTPGQTVAITGAAGAVGGYAVQLAKADGLRVIADAAPADEDLIRILGADLVVARGADVADRIRSAQPSGVDGLIDCAGIGGSVTAAIADDGQFAIVRGNRETQRAVMAAAARGITIQQTFVHDYDGNRAVLDRLRRQADTGALTLRVARTFPAVQAAQAHRLLAEGGIRGRLVLTF